jgi:hypothetical protein
MTNHPVKQPVNWLTNKPSDIRGSDMLENCQLDGRKNHSCITVSFCNGVIRIVFKNDHGFNPHMKCLRRENKLFLLLNLVPKRSFCDE